MLDQIAKPITNAVPKMAAYDILCRVVREPGFSQALAANPQEVLRAAGVIDPAMQSEVRFLVGAIAQGGAGGEMQAFAMQQMRATADTADAFKGALRRTVDQIDKGFQSTMTMYKVAFYLGVFLVLASLVAALFTGKTLLSLIFAGVGGLDILTFFFANPPKDLQRSRANLAQLQAALYNWFSDTYIWNNYLNTLNPNAGDIFPRVKDVSTQLLDNTGRMMELIDKYCEVDGKK